jgi:hypothetical protein
MTASHAVAPLPQFADALIAPLVAGQKKWPRFRGHFV